MNRPLSSYVILITLLATGELCCCLRALAEPSLAACSFAGSLGRLLGLRHWLRLQAGFACLSLCFAPYFQHRVWDELVKDAQLTSSTPKLVRLSKAQVQAIITKVFMHELTVCFYFFASLASLIWSYMGFRWIVQSQNCVGGKEDPMYACVLGFAIFLASLLYSVSSLKADCEVCGEDGDEWGRCEPHPPLPKRKPVKPVRSRPWLEPPQPVLMHAWDVGATRNEWPDEPAA